MTGMTETKTSRQIRAEQTRARVLEAGAALIDERGYDNVAIGDIIGAAGVSIGTFYHYFSSKDELYYDYVQSMYTNIDASLLEHMDLPLIYNLRHYFDTWFKEIARLSPDYLSHWLGHAADQDYHLKANSVQDVSQLHIDAIVRCFETYVGLGQLAAEAPYRQLAAQIVTVLYGVDVRFCMTNGKLELGEWTEFLTTLVSNTLGPYLREG